jgi:hypothetical protein
MKRNLLVLTIIIVLFTGLGYSAETDLQITQVGEWGSGAYTGVMVQGHYAYCVAFRNGLDIIDVSDPMKPQRIANIKTSDVIGDVFVRDNHAYITAGKEGLHIIDITHPAYPIWIGKYNAELSAGSVFVRGNFAFVTNRFNYKNYKLTILDVSNPEAPVFKGECIIGGDPTDIFLQDQYAYVSADFYSYSEEVGGLYIFDISDKEAPVQVGLASEYYAQSVYVKGQYAYVKTFSSILVFDVSDPFNPRWIRNATPGSNKAANNKDISGTKWESYISGEGQLVYGKDQYVMFQDDDYNNLVIYDAANPEELKTAAKIPLQYRLRGIHIIDDYLYLALSGGGLKIYNIKDVSQPGFKGEYDRSGFPRRIDIQGNYLYMADEWNGFQVMDIGNPQSPQILGGYWFDNYGAIEFSINGNYAYVGGYNGHVKVLNIINPATPKLMNTIELGDALFDMEIEGDKGFWLLRNQLFIMDLSNPEQPVQLSTYSLDDTGRAISVSGNFVYLLTKNYQQPPYAHLITIDISKPSEPLVVSNFGLIHGGKDIVVQGNIAIIGSANPGSVYAVDLIDKTAPMVKSQYHLGEDAIVNRVHINGNYAYIMIEEKAIKVLDISNPENIKLAGSYDLPERSLDLKGDGKHIFVANSEIGKLLVLQMTDAVTTPQLNLDRTQLYFAASLNGGGSMTGTQSFNISNTGNGIMNWTVTYERDWLQCSPTSGTNNGQVNVSVDATGLSTGVYFAPITVSSESTVGSPQSVQVRLTVYEAGSVSGPFGEFATPLDGANVQSSIAVTGWALAETGIHKVEIFREDSGSMIYIGEANLVAGARPDVEQAYPAYPYNYKAGWGYMLLTNFLPGNGNGTYKLHAIATDMVGKKVTLGVKTIHCDNANAIKPFGALDSPLQGGTASGNQYIVWGWALTPQPNVIPIDGSTIDVWVDGKNLGHPAYNLYRSDIAGLFPGYANSEGAVGYFYLDTTDLDNGIHTIQWTVTDDAHNTDGIGSRYFSVNNSSSDESRLSSSPLTLSDLPLDYNEPVHIRKGYNIESEPQKIYPDNNGNIIIEINALQRLEIQLPEGTKSVNPLPIGASIAGDGTLSWQLGPGFLGYHCLSFLVRDGDSQWKRKNILVSIIN